MLKSKKIIIVFILIISIIIVSFIIYSKNIYNLEKVSTMISSSRLSSNVHIINKVFSGNSNEFLEYSNFYIKDTMIYISQNDSSSKQYETLVDLETLKEINIIHSEQQIICSPSENIDVPLKDTFLIFSNKKNLKYKYCGKKNIEGRQCIKVSFIDKNSRENFYIDLKTNYIIKYEHYEKNNESKSYTELYNYDLNSVTNDDILKFDINNYPNYQYSEI